MKRCIAVLLIVSVMALAACKPAEPQTTGGTATEGPTTVPTSRPVTTTQPVPTTQPVATTQPIPTTQPTESTQPTQPQPTTPAEELEKFNALFGDLGSWYNLALTREYADPSQISLKNLFYLGFEGEARKPTDAEWEQLKDHRGFNEWMDLMRLPVDRMNQVLQEYFGITLEDMEDVAFEDVVYLESTNCYYHMVTDAWVTVNFNAVSVENLEDGTIRVTYTANFDDTVFAVTVKPHGDGYRILSNVRAK